MANENKVERVNPAASLVALVSLSSGSWLVVTIYPGIRTSKWFVAIPGRCMAAEKHLLCYLVLL